MTITKRYLGADSVRRDLAAHIQYLTHCAAIWALWGHKDMAVLVRAKIAKLEG